MFAESWGTRVSHLAIRKHTSLKGKKFCLFQAFLILHMQLNFEPH